MKGFPRRLAQEAESWVREGLLTAEQREVILARYPAEHDGHARFVGLLATVGGVLFAVGVSLVIKANWSAIGDWTKIGGLVALLAGAYGVGWKLKRIDGRFPKTGDACLMIGGILFLCGIALVSQIFHLDDRPANGALLWWLGIAAVPWLSRAKGAQFLSVLALLVWLGLEMTTVGSWIGISPGEAGHGKQLFRVVAVFYLLGLALWLSGIALRSSAWEEFAGLHEKWGILTTGSALFWLGFVRHDRWFRQSGGGVPDGTTLAAFALGGVLAAAAIFGAWRARRGEVTSLLPWILLTVVPVIGIVVVGPLGDGGWLWSALAWLTLFVLSVALVRVGLQSGREDWVNLGVLFIGANIIARYFDLFAAMLGGGVFFIVTGVLVTALGIFLERKRRSLLAGLRGREGGP